MVQRLRNAILLLCATAGVALGASAQDSNEARLRESLKVAFQSRTSAAALVHLYRAADLLPLIPDRAALRDGLVAVADAPDGQPEVRAHARELLRGLLKQEGRWGEAETRGAEQGFLTLWQVLGPYSDEGKLGFDNFYDPERKLDFGGTFFGKDQQISWRKAPQIPQGELVRLDALLDPPEKATGYAATFVRVEKTTSCVLRGGFNEAHKLWVNGEEVGSAKRYNGRAFDQFASPCTLRAGWNLVLVKLCNQESGWNFTLRLTDRDGRSLAGWQGSADPPKGESLTAILAKSGAPAATFTPYDPERELQKEASKSPEARLFYGEFLSRQKSFDRTEASDLVELRAAAEALKSDPWAWIALGDAETDRNNRREAYEKALVADPKSMAALTRMGRHYASKGMALVGARYLAQALEVEPSNLSALTALRRLQLDYLTDGAAARELFSLAARNPGALCVQEAHLEALRALGQGPQRVALLEALVERNQDSRGTALELLQTYRATGRVKEALALGEKVRERFPLDRESVESEARFLLGLDRPKEALAVLVPALDWAPHWAAGHQLAGDIAQALGDRERMLECYRRALELKPQDEKLRQKIAHLKPEESQFYEAYRVPKEEVPSTSERDKDATVVLLVDNEVVQVQKSGLSRRYVQKVFELRQTTAARQMQYLPIPFDPDRQSVRIMEATLLKADGTRQRAESFVTDAVSDVQYRLYYRNRNHVLDFSGLRAGDRLWVEYILSDIADAGEYGEYFGDLVLFGGPLPTLLKKYTLIAPPDMKIEVGSERMTVSPIVVKQEKQKTASWTARDLPKTLQEPGMPGATESTPYLHLSTFPDWEAMGKWYARFIQDQWEDSPAVKAKANELSAGLSTPEEKVRAIHRWVVQQTRYVGLEFGVHGYKPYKVRQVFERRFGDCKDKALLLTAMLKEAGVEACMALVRTRPNGAIHEEPASLAVFNHAICYVPGLDLYLDGTAEYSGPDELPWQDRGTRTLLVWADGKTRAAQIPPGKVGDDLFDARYEVRLDPRSNDAEFTSTIRFVGQECAWVRRSYQDVQKQRELLEKGLSGAFPGTKLREVSCSDLSDIGRPVELSAAGLLGNASRSDGPGRVSVASWLGSLSLAGQYASLKERSYPLDLAYPWSQTYTVRYLLPPGATAAPPPAVQKESPFGSAVREVTGGDGWVEIRTTITFSVNRVSPADFSAFRTFCIDVDRIASERVRVQYQGGSR